MKTRSVLVSIHSLCRLGIAFFFLTILSIASPVPAGAEELPGGLDPARLERISDHFRKHLESGEMRGGQALIWRKGEVAYSETWGLRDHQGEKPVEEDTLFRIYSMTKPITSVAVMMLYEEGHFLLRDPASRFLPELAELSVIGTDGEKAPPITIRDLLRHTSGMTYGLFSGTPVDRAYLDAGILTEDTIGEMVKNLGELPLLFPPGSRWHYSVSTDVLGRLIEVVSGKSFGEFLEERLFEPLGMDDTSFTVPASKADRFARLYARVPGENGGLTFGEPPEGWNRTYAPGATFQGGGGGLVSTAGDFLRFCRMLLGDCQLDGVRILSRKSVELMRTDHMGDVAVKYPFPGHGFGLGFTMVTDPGAGGELGSVGAYRWAGAAGTGFFIDPREEMIGIFMTQVLPAASGQSVHRKEFRRLAYQAIGD